MKLSLAALLAVGLLSGCQQQVDQEKIKAVIEANNKTFMESIASKNADAVSNLYSEDCQFLAPNMAAISGRSGVKGYMEHTVSSGVSAIKISTKEVTASNDFAVEQGTYEVFVMDSIKVDEGKYLVEWKKVGEQWLIHRDMLNSDYPAPRTVANKDETVWVVTYYVKDGKGADFENFVKSELAPAIDNSNMANAQAFAQTRLIAPKQADKNGHLKYVFIMDPVVKGANYDIGETLIAKHGEQVGKEKFKQFNSLLAKDFEFTSGVQTDK